MNTRLALFFALAVLAIVGGAAPVKPGSTRAVAGARNKAQSPVPPSSKSTSGKVKSPAPLSKKSSIKKGKSPTQLSTKRVSCRRSKITKRNSDDDDPCMPTPIAPPGSKIVLGGKTYTLGEKFGAGANSFVYYTDDKKNVAKQLKPESYTSQTTFLPDRDKLKADFEAEVGFTQKAGKLLASGMSPVTTVGSDGDKRQYYWIVTPFAKGHPLTETDKYKNTVKSGGPSCKAYLGEVRNTFVKAMKDLETKTGGFVHLDAHDRNSLWNNDGMTFDTFIDFGEMAKVGTDKYKQAVALELGIPIQNVPSTLEGYAMARAKLNYKEPENCN